MSISPYIGWRMMIQSRTPNCQNLIEQYSINNIHRFVNEKLTLFRTFRAIRKFKTVEGNWEFIFPQFGRFSSKRSHLLTNFILRFPFIFSFDFNDSNVSVLRNCFNGNVRKTIFNSDSRNSFDPWQESYFLVARSFLFWPDLRLEPKFFCT